MKIALITGGMGFIGSFIARQLLEEGRVDRVVCLDHFGRYVDSTRPEFTDYRKIRFEGIFDKIIIERGESKYFSVMCNIFEKYQPDFVFHLAALPLAKLDNLNTQEAVEGSVQSTSNILEIIGQIKDRNSYCPKRFIYASSSMVYSDFVSDIALEDHPTRPKEIYGTMKLAGEVITQGLGQYFNIPFTIIRPSAVYGPTDMNRRVSQIFIEKALRGKKIEVQGADEKLDFSYVKDVANGFVLAAMHDNAIGEIFNITYGKAHTLLEFVLCLKKHFPNLEYQITERDTFRPKRGTLSIEKAKKLLGYEPKYNLQEGIDEYVACVRKHHTLLKKVE